MGGFSQSIHNFSGASNKSYNGAFRKKGIVFEIITGIPVQKDQKVADLFFPF
jgi:hypothetical protein